MFRDRRRIAFFGGTFDPPHNGHVEVASAALTQLTLNWVYFVPASQNPHKTDQPLSPAEDRLKMLRLATDQEPRFGIWDGELSRGGPSYTLHSVEHIERVYPNSHLFWIIGSDQLQNLSQWYGIAQLVRKLRFILVHRPGHSFEWPRIPGLTVYPVDNALNPVSSTGIRTRIRQGQPITGLVPPPVETYLRKKGLYGEGTRQGG